MKSNCVFPVLTVLFGIFCLSLLAFNQPTRPEIPLYQYRQFSTIESIVPGGMGRSRVIITDENGQVVERELRNFYSFTGINFGNVAGNDRAIVGILNDFTKEGWELFSTSTGVQSPSEVNSSGIFITRYLFRKPAY
jgi:hypothetical protein